MKPIIIGAVLLLTSTSIFGFNRTQIPTEPHLTQKDEKVLAFAREAGFQSNGEVCAVAITAGHPVFVELYDRSKWTVSDVTATGMLARNAKRCVCIGEKSHDFIDLIPREHRTMNNIKIMHFNVIAFMALKHLRYHAWERMDGINETSQRYMVERIANYCQ